MGIVSLTYFQRTIEAQLDEGKSPNNPRSNVACFPSHATELHPSKTNLKA